MSPETAAHAPIVYPESDGLPMSDNTKQFRWIFTLAGNLDALFHADPNVFVGGNLLWYPVEGRPDIRTAPDVFVVFGRPKGERGSYRQWEENDVPMTVVFEVLSPSNTTEEMMGKLLAYEEYGVAEYYLYDPDTNKLNVYQRGQAALVGVRFGQEYSSPRLGIRFDLRGAEMQVFYPDGQPFLTFPQLQQRAHNAEKDARTARARATKAQEEARAADTRATKAQEEARAASARASKAQEEAHAADARATRAEQNSADVKRQLEQSQQRMARLTELTLKVLSGQANAAEIAELESMSQRQS